MRDPVGGDGFFPFGNQFFLGKCPGLVGALHGVNLSNSGNRGANSKKLKDFIVSVSQMYKKPGGIRWHEWV